MKAKTNQGAKLKIREIAVKVSLQCAQCQNRYDDTVLHKNVAQSASIRGFFRNQTYCPKCGNIDSVNIDLSEPKKNYQK